MLRVAIGFGLLVAAVALLSALRARRRRARNAPLASALAPLPAGVKHLADCVSELSDLGIRLGRSERGVRRARLGVLPSLR